MEKHILLDAGVGKLMLSPVVPTGRIREAKQYIANKVAIVTGGGSEIGRATASLLADKPKRGGNLCWLRLDEVEAVGDEGGKFRLPLCLVAEEVADGGLEVGQRRVV